MKFILGVLSIVLSIFVSAQTKKEGKFLDKIRKQEERFEFFKALDIANNSLEKLPESAILYKERGDINFYLNHHYSAFTDYSMAIKLQPEYLKDTLVLWETDTAFKVRSITDSTTFASLDPTIGYNKRYTRDDTLRGSLNPDRSCIDIKHYDLTIQIDPESKSIKGQNKITFLATTNAKRIQIDLFRQYALDSVYLNTLQQKVERYNDLFYVILDTNLIVGELYNLTIAYVGVPQVAINPPWEGGFTWENDLGEENIGVSCEHLGASAWWPNKDHLSDKPDSMDIRIIAPKRLKAVANGNQTSLVSYDALNNLTSWHVSYPINNYNVTFYLSNFNTFSEQYYRSVTDSLRIDYYVLPQNYDTAVNYYAKTKEIIEVFEDKFGRYPFSDDGLAFCESPFAGMEHQSAIAIGNNYGKDTLYPIENGIDRLVVHETAHEWWGNAVAIGDMADVWINEGMATYAEHLFVEDRSGKEAYLNVVAENFSDISNVWPMVGDYGVNCDAFKGQDVYYKGAAMMHNLRCLFDDDKSFFALIKDFYQARKSMITTSSDFEEMAQAYTNKDVKPFFEVFFHQASPPVLKYFPIKKGKNFALFYFWDNVPEGFELPVALVLNYWDVLRLDVTTELQEISYGNIAHYYLPNAYTLDETIDLKNSFTYYFSELMTPEEFIAHYE